MKQKPYPILWAFFNKIAHNNAKLFFIFTIFIASCTLISAFVVEYMGYPPCILCIYQRFPYAALVIVSIFALFLKKHHKPLLLLIMLIEVVSIGLGGFHSAIEFGWINPLATCSSQINYANLSLEQLKSYIDTAPLADCSKPAILIIGLSMAQWNFIFNIFLLAISVLTFKTLSCQNQNSQMKQTN
jgi:disulfide bond formation protein DsbB